MATPEDTYSKIVMGKDEPKAIIAPAKTARQFGWVIPSEVDDKAWVVIGPGGEWELFL